MAAEAKEPHKTLPRAVFGTIFIVTILYCIAAWALVSMQHYADISEDSCFSDAFRSHNQEALAQIVSIGELICLPLVALVSFLAQPRIQYAMAKDNLLPKVFAEIDSKGNLSKSIWLTGLVCTLIAVFVPFSYLDDMISAGVLFSFNLSNSSVVIIRQGSVQRSDLGWHLCSKLLVAFHVLAIGLAYCSAQMVNNAVYNDPILVISSTVLFAGLLAIGVIIDYRCPENPDPEAVNQYRIPFMPYPPLIGIVINYVLIAQLSALGLVLILFYLLTALIYYFVYCIGRDDAIVLSNKDDDSGLLLKSAKAGTGDYAYKEIGKANLE